MALIQNLDIYGDSYCLLLELFDVYKQIDRQLKYNIGNTLLMSSINLFEDIEFANRTINQKDRSYHLTKVLINLNKIKILLRLCSDRRLIGIKKHAQLSKLVDSICKRVTAWKNNLDIHKK